MLPIGFLPLYMDCIEPLPMVEGNYPYPLKLTNTKVKLDYVQVHIYNTVNSIIGPYDRIVW